MVPEAPGGTRNNWRLRALLKMNMWSTGEGGQGRLLELNDSTRVRQQVGWGPIRGDKRRATRSEMSRRADGCFKQVRQRGQSRRKGKRRRKKTADGMQESCIRQPGIRKLCLDELPGRAPRGGRSCQKGTGLVLISLSVLLTNSLVEQVLRLLDVALLCCASLLLGH